MADLAVNLEEDFVDAAIREVREESGCDVKVTHVVGCYMQARARPGDINNLVLCFNATCDSGKVLVDQTDKEMFDFEWFDEKELIEGLAAKAAEAEDADHHYSARLKLPQGGDTPFQRLALEWVQKGSDKCAWPLRQVPIKDKAPVRLF